ncbi:uncharacterized protein LOC143039514 [Oratosquilla oratoria]|uniref:uncharacterized protein LOC143039514 n=1 Tax=Oratosquilla oratoria TaxID=337810 RepID=UPI003F76A2CB
MSVIDKMAEYPSFTSSSKGQVFTMDEMEKRSSVSSSSEGESSVTDEVEDYPVSPRTSDLSSLQSFRVSDRDKNLLKIQKFIKRIGQYVLLNVFQWGYQGGDRYPYPYVLDSSPNRQKLKKILNRWMGDLKATKPETEFDVPLLYHLIQCSCGLAPFEDRVWESTEGDELESLIFLVKNYRDNHCHAKPNEVVSEERMKKMATELRKLYTRILQRAGEYFKVDSERVEVTIYHIQTAILAVMKADVSIEFKDKNALKKLLQSDGKLELCEAYKGVQKMWLGTQVLCDEMFDIGDIYMKTDMMLTVANENVDIEEMFEVWKAERKHRDILVVTGSAGSGKTTMFKYLIHNWITKCERIKGLLDYDLVLYVECRSSCMVSLGQFIQTLMPMTAANFKKNNDIRFVLSRLRVLVLVDGVDEMSPATIGFLTSIFCIEEDTVHIICSTRNEGFSSLINICKRTERKTVQFSLGGVAGSDIRNFTFQVLRKFGNETYQTAGWNDICGFFLARSSRLTSALRSPLLLTILVLLWVWKVKVGRLTTGSSVNEEIERLICIRLVENLSIHPMTRKVSIRDLQARVFRILEKIHKTAFEMLSESKTILPRSHVKALKVECVQLGLPFKEVTSAFLNVRQSFEGTRVVNSYSFYHKTDQEFKAAKYSTLIFARTGDFNAIRPHEPNSTVMSLQYYTYQIGILRNNYPSEMLKNHSGDIVHAANMERDVTEGEWLDFLVEGDCHDTLCHALGRIMMSQENKKWVIEDAMVNGLATLLQYTAPEALDLKVGANPDGFPNLRELLPIVAAVPLKLWLDFQDHYVYCTSVRSDFYLAQVLDHPGRRCVLKGFSGSLSCSMIPRLAECMTWVCLRVNFEELLVFDGKLPALSQLRRFELLLNDDVYHSASKYPTLRSSAVVLLALPSLRDDHVIWACDVLQAILSKAFFRIKLFGCKLSIAGVEAFMKGLHQNQVRIQRDGTLQVRHEYDVTSQDQDRLTRLAKTYGYKLELRKGD